LPNALDPDLMTAPERLAEIGEILAAGLIRLRARQRETEARRSGESSLDFPRRPERPWLNPGPRRKSGE
jgi:hypothetical protein